MKNVNNEPDKEWDFGFTTHSEEEVSPTDDRAQRIYDAILPLLNNLAKNADTQAYINWPNRASKIAEFKKRLESILNNT